MVLGWWDELGRNLRAGLRFIALRPFKRGDFVVSVDQLVLLALVDLLLGLGVGWANVESDAEVIFNAWAILVNSGLWLSVALAAWLTSRLMRQSEILLPLLVIFYAVTPWLNVFQPLAVWLLELLVSEALLVTLYGALLILCWVGYPLRLFYLLLDRSRVRALFATLLFSVLWLPVLTGIVQQAEYWYVIDGSSQEADPYAVLDSETLLFDQSRRLQQVISTLAPQRPGIADLYFVAFAPYAAQNVFRNEVTYISALMKRRFDAASRSVTLINHLDDYQNQPLATVTNLRAVLQSLADVMDLEEDLLVLYLTSHGSRDHQLVVEFGEMPLNNLTSVQLTEMLQEAGIKWRVVMVSACYAGGFVAPLENATTFVAAAAASDRTSFGCSNENDFTYFGEALFKDQLSQEYSLVTAMQQVQQSILIREQQEGLQPSLPEFFVGIDMEKKLQQLSARLTKLGCAQLEQVMLASSDKSSIEDCQAVTH